MRKSKETSIISKTITVAIILIMIIAIINPFMLFNSNTYTGTVTEKTVKRNDDKDKYIIFTELDNGDIRVFENTDAFIFGKFNSSDVYAKIKVGNTYIFKTRGIRIPFLSSYENIMKVEKIE